MQATDNEILKIAEYIKKNGIHLLFKGSLITAKPSIADVCPFLDKEQKKCLVYEVRPEICSRFKCDMDKKEERELPTTLSNRRNSRTISMHFTFSTDENVKELYGAWVGQSQFANEMLVINWDDI